MNPKNQYLVDGKYSFQDLVDIDRLREILEHFSQATGFTTGLVSYPDQKLFIATGWRDICTKFHRSFSSSAVHCEKSNLDLTSHLMELKALNVRHCKNGLIDGATPIIIKGVHLANLFTGQILFKEPDIDFFRKQGQAYGYDVEAYLEALEKVPIVTEKAFKKAMTFLSEIAVLLAEQGLTELQIRKTAQVAKEKEEALRKSEEKYRLLADNITDNIWVLDLASLKFGYLSPSIVKITGFTADEIMGLHIKDVLTPTSMELAISVLNEELSAESRKADPARSRTLELEQYHKDGTTVWTEMSMRFINDSQGKPISILGVTRDITERKQAEVDRERLLAAIEHAAETIVITDANGNIQYTNPAFEEVTGYNRKEVIGESPRILKSGEHEESFYHQMWQTITAGDIWKGKLINRKKDGTFYTEEATISPVLDETGTIVNFVAVKRDITDDIQMEEKLHQAQKMEAIGTLAGGIAHDFNNILSAIFGYSELSLTSVEPGSWIHGNLSKVLKASERAKDLVQQILTFGRQGERELLPVKVKLIVKEVIKFIRATLPTTIEIQQHIKENPTVIADPTQIHQVIMNLCTNAGHAMQDNGGTLEIGLESIELNPEFTRSHPALQPGKHIKLTVSDTGTGITPENLERIFDPYFSTKEKGKGAGLGLATVHGIIKSHGGIITVESQIGKGTKFEIYLPSVVDREENKEGSDLKLIGGKEQILIVDDEQDIIEVEKMMLEQLGYTVTAKDKANEALQIFSKQADRFDLVISDMTMPKMTGDKLASELIKIRSDIPVLLCTGFSEGLSEEKVTSLGIKGFLMKPVTLKNLSHVVRKVLDEKPS